MSVCGGVHGTYLEVGLTAITTVEPRTLYNTSTFHVFTFTLQRTELNLGREVRFCAGLFYPENAGAVTQ